MALFRNYLALDIHPTELRAVSLRRKGKGSQLTGARTLPLEDDLLGASVREPNILHPARFAQAVREVLVPLAGREERLALSLPETFGRVLLTEVDTPLRNREEGLSVLKWQLKKNLPEEGSDLLLDYQVLGRTEGGRYRVLVAFLADAVLGQVEEIFDDIGFFPLQVDFHFPNLYNFYRPRLNLAEDFFLLGIEQGAFSLQFFQDGVLSFYRSRYGLDELGAVFRELNRSIASCRENIPNIAGTHVYLHSTWEETEDLAGAIQSIFEGDVFMTNPHLERMVPEGAAPGGREGASLVAAIGAAERMIWRPE